VAGGVSPIDIGDTFPITNYMVVRVATLDCCRVATADESPRKSAFKIGLILRALEAEMPIAITMGDKERPLAFCPAPY